MGTELQSGLLALQNNQLEGIDGERLRQFQGAAASRPLLHQFQVLGSAEPVAFKGERSFAPGQVANR